MDRKGILLVDDEALALKYFQRAFAERFPIYAAPSAQEALEILELHEERIGVVVTDQRMPESTGVELLKIVRAKYPNTVRILTTAYSDMEALVEAINSGAVYCFVSKPWVLEDLEHTLADALDHHEDQVQESLLLEQKVGELKAQILEDRAYEVGLIAAKIGHYVHNALCPVTFLIDHLLDRGEAHGNYSVEFLQSVRTHIYEVARTLKELEQTSMPASAAEYQSLDLNEILDKALADTEIIRKQKRLRLEKMTTSAVPPIKGVPSQIGKLFRFMIAEEIVSLPAESLVRVRFSPHEVEGDALGVNVEFEDFVPVAPQMCPDSLLHPFNLRGTNPREFGIFLVSCYFIVRHHGGSLNAKVKQDGGLSFSFFLPGDPVEAIRANPDMFEDFPIKPRVRR